MMRSSNRLMSFPAGTMITVKGYPFVLRDAAAVMGTPENFGEAMCELAKAEQMQDQSMDGLKGDPSRVRQPNAETVAALQEALAAGDEGEPVEIGVSNDFRTVLYAHQLRGRMMDKLQQELHKHGLKYETTSAVDVKVLPLDAEKVVPTPTGGEIVAEPDSEQKLWLYDDLRRTGVKGHFYTAKAYDKDGVSFLSEINFQNGPVPENGVNGLTNEALLAILIHRTKILDERFPCEENKAAIDAMAYAREAFESRTKRRQAAGIEGKMVEQST